MGLGTSSSSDWKTFPYSVWPPTQPFVLPSGVPFQSGLSASLYNSALHSTPLMLAQQYRLLLYFIILCVSFPQHSGKGNLQKAWEFCQFNALDSPLSEQHLSQTIWSLFVEWINNLMVWGRNESVSPRVAASPTRCGLKHIHAHRLSVFTTKLFFFFFPLSPFCSRGNRHGEAMHPFTVQPETCSGEYGSVNKQ